MEKFTKGPWFNEKAGDSQYIKSAVTEHVLAIAEPDLHERGECSANAALIAAAPELYEALEFAVGIVECWQAKNDHSRARGDAEYQQGSEFCQAAKSALRKARGEE